MGNPNPVKKFQKGVSGNPGGRPKTAPEFKTLCQEKSLVALEVVAKILENRFTKDNDRLRAAEIIIERAYGKAPQEIKGAHSDAFTRAWTGIIERAANIGADGKVHIDGKGKVKA